LESDAALINLFSGAQRYTWPLGFEENIRAAKGYIAAEILAFHQAAPGSQNRKRVPSRVVPVNRMQGPDPDWVCDADGSTFGYQIIFSRAFPRGKKM
jgi:hypothetical protein